jgi:glycosyltransferase involved in cell wall biosynthesis
MILFLSVMEAAPWGASEKLWSEAAIRLARVGHDVGASVKHWHPAPAEWRALQTAGIRLWCRQRRSAGDDERHYVELLTARPDVAVISSGDNGMSGIVPMATFAAHGIPYIVVCHNSVLFWPRDKILDRARDCFRRARKIFFVSRQNQHYTELMLGIPLHNAAIVRSPVGISHDVCLPWPAGDVPSLAMVGRLDPSAKGHDLLFMALRAARWRRRALRVVLYGTGQNERSLKRIRDLFDLSMVEFAGVANPIDIWTKAHMLLLPSRCEGLPLVLLEAMLAGRPAIATDVGGNSEFVVDGETGFLARAPEVGLLDDAMETAWSKRQDWPMLGAHAARRVRQLLPADPTGAFIDSLADCLDLDQLSRRPGTPA